MDNFIYLLWKVLFSLIKKLLSAGWCIFLAFDIFPICITLFSYDYHSNDISSQISLLWLSSLWSFKGFSRADLFWQFLSGLLWLFQHCYLCLYCRANFEVNIIAAIFAGLYVLYFVAVCIQKCNSRVKFSLHLAFF